MGGALFEVFGISIYPYSLLIFIGVLCLAWVFFYRVKKLKVDNKIVDRVTIIAMIGGIFAYLGASFFDTLWHCMELAMVDGKFVIEKFKLDFDIGGITFAGGLVTSFAVFFLIFPLGMKEDKRQALFYMDQIAIGILIAHAFGRIGCWFGGCCYGAETDFFLGVYYPEAGTVVHPTQLYEAAFLFISFIIFFFFIKKNHTEKYLIAYGVWRFLLEFLRGDDRGVSPFGFLTPSQFLSLVMIAGGIACIFIRKWVYKKELDENKEPVIRYYQVSYKNLIPGLFKSCNCPNCNQKMKLKWKSTITNANEIELINKEHLVYRCLECNIDQEIKQ